LVHITAYALITIFYKRLGFFIPADITIFIQLIIAVLAGIGFYKIVERPLLEALQQWKPQILPKKQDFVLEAPK
jgi:peptidoglycan/LPS O-acetylase OafA/YrhL